MSGGLKGKAGKPFDQQNKTFVEHRPCEKCGSRNNVSVWYNHDLGGETWWCYTCQEGVRDIDLIKPGSRPIKLEHPALPPEKFLAEGWNQEVVDQYHILYENNVWYYQYANPNGLIVACKGRDYNKGKDEDWHFFWLVKNEDHLLYGMDTRQQGDKLLICEGEGDAASAKAMLGRGWCCVSIPDGANESKRKDLIDKSIKRWYEWIDQFDDVYICFDNDQVGLQYANKNAEFIGYKARVINLPRYQTKTGVTKDARDFSSNKLVREFRDAVSGAPRRVPSFIVPDSARIERLNELLFDDERRTGVSTGLHQFDEIIGGLRSSEVSVLFADPFMGKSSFGRYLMCHLSTVHNYKCLYITLEESQAVADARLIEIVNGIKLIAKDHGITKEDVPKLVQSISNVIMTNYTGEITTQQLVKSIEYAAKIEDVKFILFDHITAATDGAGDKQQNAIRMMLNAVNTAALEFNVHVMVISHTKRAVEQMYGQHNFGAETKRPKNPTIRDAFGSSALEQYAHLILSIVRDIDKSHIWVLKNRMTGRTGCASVVYNSGVFTDGTSARHTGQSKWGDNPLQPRNETNGEVQVSREDKKQVPSVSAASEASQEGSNTTGAVVSGPEGVLATSDVATRLPGHEDRQDSRGKGTDGERLPAKGGGIPQTAPQPRLYALNCISNAKPAHPSGKAPQIWGLGDISEDSVDEL